MALKVCLNCDKTIHLIKSLKWASRAIQENKNDWLCNYTLAFLFYRLGNIMSATAFIDIALDNVPVGQPAIDQVKALKALVDSK